MKKVIHYFVFIIILINSMQCFAKVAPYRTNRKPITGFMSIIMDWDTTTLTPMLQGYDLLKKDKTLPNEFSKSTSQFFKNHGTSLKLLVKKLWKNQLNLKKHPIDSKVERYKEPVDYAYSRDISRSLTFLGKNLIIKKHVDAALGISLLIYRFGQDIQWGQGNAPDTIAFSVGIALKDIAITELAEPCMKKMSWTKTKLQKFKRLLMKYQNENISFDQILSIDIQAQSYNNRMNTLIGAEKSATTPEKKTVVEIQKPIYKVLFKQEYDKIYNFYMTEKHTPYMLLKEKETKMQNKLFKRLDECKINLPIKLAKLNALHAINSITKKQLQQKLSEVMCEYVVLNILRTSIQNYSNYKKHQFTSQLKTTGVLLLADYYGGNLIPNSIEDLHKSINKENLIDPFSRNKSSLKLIKSSTNNYILYSIGKDEKDNKGDSNKDLIVAIFPAKNK